MDQDSPCRRRAGCEQPFPRFQRNPRRAAEERRAFLATIEPWHGDKVVVYTKPDKPGDLWDRHVIATGLQQGHALAVLDVDGSGNDVIVSGYRGGRGGVVLFRASDETATHWDKQVLDDGTITCQGMFVADLMGTGRPGVVGIGGSTHNVKLFRFDGQ